ncbi:MAG: transcriptional regulator [Bradyrhizobium sp.]|nr:transcriptional regulator [Bradyrhizobium sp.]
MVPPPAPAPYTFGAFSLDAETGALFCGGEPTLLGQRGSALLRILLEHAGSVVSKAALIEAAWPGLSVEDSNLTVQVAALRRALEQDDGGRWIETLPRRGYRYVGPPVTRREASADEAGRRSALPVPERPSIAVLPFEQSGEDAWFADGMVGAIEPRLRRAEAERIRRKRPESLDAYELVLRAQPDVDSGMPDRAALALPQLRRALALDPSYALAHGLAAMSHHNCFLRAGLKEEDRLASVRHARLAIEHGRDDAFALTFAGFSLGMDAHDRQAAFAAFEAALALSPSTALAWILGSVVAGWSGQAERAIDWSERGMRLSPFDPWAFAAYDAQALGHFCRDRYAEAASAAYKSNLANPAHSITWVQLAASLAALGRLDDAKAAAACVLELQPTFRITSQFAGVDCEPELAAKLGKALRAAGLPE